jgi:RNA polymerase sigma factor (TIGR02999 family)
MQMALKQEREADAFRASLLRSPRADWLPAQLNGVRGTRVTADPESQHQTGDHQDARTDLFTTLYAQLRQIAQSALRRSGPQLTVSPTTLLHEAYLRISGRDALQFPDGARFMAYASRAMRSLVIDFVRERHAQKRGAGFEITSIKTEANECAADELELKRISDALDELGAMDASLAELVDLKFFCGFSFGDIAAMRSVSERTVQRDWNKARLYLHDVLREP